MTFSDPTYQANAQDLEALYNWIPLPFPFSFCAILGSVVNSLYRCSGIFKGWALQARSRAQGARYVLRRFVQRNIGGYNLPQWG